VLVVHVATTSRARGKVRLRFMTVEWASARTYIQATVPAAPPLMRASAIAAARLSLVSGLGARVSTSG
jgi:hypothetical protein